MTGLIHVGINEVVTDSQGVSVTALHISALSVINAVDVSVGVATAYVTCCATLGGDTGSDPTPSDPSDGGLRLDASVAADASTSVDASVASVDASVPVSDAGGTAAAVCSPSKPCAAGFVCTASLSSP